MNIKLHKILLKFGFTIAGIYWGLIVSLILDKGIISSISFISITFIGYILGVVSNAIIDYCQYRDLKKFR